MNQIGKKFSDILRIDKLAVSKRGSCANKGHYPSTFQHPIAISFTTMLFILVVVSFDKYTISALIPFLLYPISLASLNNLPIKYLLKKLLFISPFAIFIAIFNPIMDTEIFFKVNFYNLSVPITGGEVSFVSILLRFILTVSATLILVSIIGFNGLCFALLKFKVPKPFVIQLLFIYRYIFVLIEEAERMLRAQAMRTFNSNKIAYKLYITLLGHLLIRTIDRAERVYMAMLSRGFDGEVRILSSTKLTFSSFVFIVSWSIFFIYFRLINFPVKVGELLERLFG